MNFGVWPGPAIDWMLTSLSKGEDGVREVATQMAEDKMNFHGLQDATAAQKARIVSLILETPVKTPVELLASQGDSADGEVSLSVALQAQAKQVAKARPQVSKVRRLYDTVCFYYHIMRMARMQKKKKGGGSPDSRYVIFTAAKS